MRAWNPIALTFAPQEFACGSRLGIAKAIQSGRSPLMLCRLALREKRSECFLRLIGPYSFGENLILEFNSLLQLVTEYTFHEVLARLQGAGGLCCQSLCGFRCCG